MSSTEACARELLDVVPLIMRTIRVEMRRRRGLELTVPQFRALLYIERHPGASLAEVAGFLGLTPPSTSRLVDGLVDRGQVARGESQADRRRLTLVLTLGGRSLLQAARRGTTDRLAQVVEGLTSTQRERLVRALEAVRPIFAASGETPEAA
jgi:DNA-binding MarR family transcriptional regulator